MIYEYTNKTLVNFLNLDYNLRKTGHGIKMPDERGFYSW